MEFSFVRPVLGTAAEGMSADLVMFGKLYGDLPSDCSN